MEKLTFWNPDIFPYAIAWDAWAAFVVGMAAVIGAVIIGGKQAGIAKRQADITAKQTDVLERQVGIAAKQVALENAKQRADLYDKRLDVCSGFERYVAVVAMNDGAIPNVDRDEFFTAWAASRYLFGAEVYALGQKLLNASVNLRNNAQRLERLPDHEREERRGPLIDAIVANHDALNDLRAEFQVLMMAYMGLGDVRMAPVDNDAGIVQ